MRLGPPDLRQENEDYYVGHTLDVALHALLAQVRLELQRAARGTKTDGAAIDARALAIVRTFARNPAPRCATRLDSDVRAAYHGDPAARSVDEVLLCYPGVAAMAHHRLAHVLYDLGVPLLARIVAELAHAGTGIDIHPGADDRRQFFHRPRHGGRHRRVRGHRRGRCACIRLSRSEPSVSQRPRAATLRKGEARHPIVEDDVVIYAVGNILGRITIGRGATIGGNVWLTRSVPARQSRDASDRTEVRRREFSEDRAEQVTCTPGIAVTQSVSSTPSHE